MERFNVLILIKGLGVGGAEMLLVNGLPHLDRESFNYEVGYLLPHKNDLVGAFEDAGIPTHQLGGSRGNPISAVGDLRDLIVSRKTDLIDAHLPVPGVVARIARRVPQSPALVYHEHSLSVQRRISRMRFAAFGANVATYGLADVIVAVSNDTAADVRRFNKTRTPVVTILNGIPLPDPPPRQDVEAALAELGVPKDHQVVGHVAKMVSKKAQDDLIDAAALVLRARPRTTFLLIGKGELRESLMDRARNLGIADRVRFPGFVDDLTALVAGFDVFALSSLHEGLPTVLIEAHGLGVPVVSTDVGGTSEIVDNGKTGLLVPPRRPEDLAEALIRVLEDDALRAGLGREAYDRRDRFEIGRCVRETEAVYHRLLGSRRREAAE